MKKPVRKPSSMGFGNLKGATAGYKTSTGAQQYVKGNSPKERSETIYKATLGSLRATKYSSAIFRGLEAANAAENSRQIAGIAGKKAAKTDTSVKMYDKFEKEWSALQKKSRKK